MTSRYFCTLFDSGYLFKGIAMLRSLSENCPTAHVYVLCMDEKTHEMLEAFSLSFVTCIPLSDIENEELLAAKSDRSIAEYCWTLSPCLPWYILEQNPSVDFITYLDADLLFYSSIEPIFDEIKDNSIAIIEHRFTPRLKEREVNGRFCVEWVSFRRDEEGMACLSRWREQCIEWCYYRVEEGRMGDQKYLDEWPNKYSSCHIIKHVGAGIAPWNYDQYDFGFDANGNITIAGEPLIFYHFHQFQLLDDGNFMRLSTFYTSVCIEPVCVYETYENTLKQIIIDTHKISPSFSEGLQPASLVRSQWLKGVLQKKIGPLIPNNVRNIVRGLLRR